jgi:hypothetical protein
MHLGVSPELGDRLPTAFTTMTRINNKTTGSAPSSGIVHRAGTKQPDWLGEHVSVHRDGAIRPFVVDPRHRC